ncbi:phosphotransferase [Streptomyces sp. NPDC046716]|uniref:phosphotransferase family protein n=1 Tax=Streptomyces sp. NPDC046716 TaxID=3157093 RepID=UPI003407A2C9
MAVEKTSRARRTAATLSRSEPEIEGPLKGYHHETYVISLKGASDHLASVRWKCREPREGLYWFDRRCFPSEEAVVEALTGRITSVPELIETKGVRLQRFVEGETLGARYGVGDEIPEAIMRQILNVFAELARIQPATLTVKCLCAAEDRVRDGDTNGFLERLIRFTEMSVYRKHRNLYGDLFAELGIPGDAFKSLREQVAGLRERPFRLLHADLHRENLILDPSDRLWVIDWELAMFGDPLYDLATHLHLMRYPEVQEKRVVEEWRDVEGSASSVGLDDDLPLLLAYKRAQSVFTDVIRSALTLRNAGRAVDRTGLLAATARKLHSVLLHGAPPLGVISVPATRSIATIMREWLG